MSSLAGVRINPRKGTIHKGFKSYPLAGARAQIVSEGGMDRRTTGTRVVGGALIAGPVGALVGGVAKKKRDMRQVFLIVEGDGFVLSEEVVLPKGAISGKAQQRTLKKAYKFAAELTSEGLKLQGTAS